MHTNRLYGAIARRTHPTQYRRHAARSVRAAERNEIRREITAELAALKAVTV
ncbi:hypothetical protein GCM10012275_64570 [Longimycelium tulufanense]|uniref:Uncharacterized protein n=1 Tax=Longimycelium tulufanense TaxID=907463 RepID=A0A8J3CKS2_9PSEU|nr:hypothetical protein [Longimycelium tulufanense]GGM84906.1 hypothetical protein GCM10012275_64570 [Longimycelium tulufanense]